ncbi:unnamed protein product [Adineta ricciae]|uniref:Uncharacterized protein n=1 Tax=Adineta ricciae TaxID=249248 RepID=A0A816CK06_ADIRI|nr:unnamed protein product [Adineta ricciae]
MLTIKCIQLIPAQYEYQTEYSIQNYLVKKSTDCYDVVSYDSSSRVLFSNQCQELCPEQYCQLFDSQPNTTIFNIFYSDSSTYDIMSSANDGILSYDYLYFDTCSADNHQRRVLIIIVFVLAGFIALITVLLIARCIIRRKNLKEGNWHPYDWRWVRDMALCRHPTDGHVQNRPENEPNPLYIIEYNTQPSVDSNRPQTKSRHNATSRSQVTPASSPNIAVKRRRNYVKDYSTDTNSVPSHIDGSSGLSIPANPLPLAIIHHSDSGESLSNDSVDASSRHHSQREPQSSIRSALNRLSSKASSVLTGTHSSHGYDSLGGRISREYPIIRL